MILAIIIIACLILFIVMPTYILWQYRRAISQHGYPTLPPELSDLTLGHPNYDLAYLSDLLPKIEEKRRYSPSGDLLLNSLYSGCIQNNEGIWNADIELCNDEVSGYSIVFKSSIDSRLNKCWGDSDPKKAYYLESPKGS